MNLALERAARAAGLASAENEHLRLAFAHDCVQRVAHLLEDPQAIAALQALGRFVAGEIDRNECEALINAATRQYAKRQDTWFRREHWLKEDRHGI